MPKKARKSPARAARAGGVRAKPRRAARPIPPVEAPRDVIAARERFVSDLMIRGEAAKRDRTGKLPLRATHVIKKQKADGTAEVERVRFKTF